MACEGGMKVMNAVVLAWSSGVGTTDLFIPATGPLRTADWGQAIVTLDVEVSTNTANIEVQRSYVLSDDGITWGTPVAMADAGFVSALGRSYGASATTVPFTKAYVRFGVTTNQKAGSALEQMRLVHNLSLVKR